MAYLDLQESTSSPAYVNAAARMQHRVEAPAAFTATEWNVIELAQHDRLTSLAEPGRLARVLARTLGGRPALRLADARLEMLRRLAVLAWHHGYAVPASAIKACEDAGYTSEQLELLFSRIGARRSVRHRRARG